MLRFVELMAAPVVRRMVLGSLASLWGSCTLGGASSGFAGDTDSQEAWPEGQIVHASAAATMTQWVFDPRRGIFTYTVNPFEPTRIESLLLPEQAPDGSVTGISSLFPFSVIKLSSATLGEAANKSNDVSPMIPIANCPSHVTDGLFRLTPLAPPRGRSSSIGSQISEHYTWSVANGNWSIQSAHCLREEPIGWEDAAAIRANLRQFTSDDAWLDVLVKRVQSLRGHGVQSLRSPKLAAWQIEAFLSNPKYVPSPEIRAVFEAILGNMRVHSWESLVFHLSAAWQQFLSTVGSDDRVVIMRRLDLRDPAFSGNYSRSAEIKSDDWVYELIRDWTGNGFFVFDYASKIENSGQWDGDTLVNLGTLRQWTNDSTFTGNVRFVYLDDWILTGNLTIGALSHAARFAEITDAFRMDVVTAFQSDDPWDLTDYLTRWPYQTKLSLHRAAGVATYIIPTLTSVTSLEERSLLFIDWMPPYSLGVLPYHRGDKFNNVRFRLDGSGAIYYSNAPLPGARTVTLFDLLNLRVSDPPYR